jgi:hypothetical protein
VFCAAACRTAFHSAARRWVERAIVSGTLTVADLRNGNPEACTLLPAFSSTPAGSEQRTRSILAATDAGATIVEDDFPAEPEAEALPSCEVDAVVFWGPRLNFWSGRCFTDFAETHPGHIRDTQLPPNFITI